MIRHGVLVMMNTKVATKITFELGLVHGPNNI
jgi:hypothetical protein